MKYLLLNQAFVPDVASSGQHLADVAVDLARRGHTVTVVTSCRAYTDSRQRFARDEMWKGVRILRVASCGFGLGSFWRRFLDAVVFVTLACVRACLLPHADVVVALTSPPLLSVLGLCLAWIRRSRFVYWVMDLNPDQAFAAGCLRAESMHGAMLEWLSRVSLRHADRVIVLDRFMAGRVVQKGVCASRVTIIPPWSHDPNVQFDAAGRERFRRRHGLAGKFVVMYSGNHSLCHPLDTVLEAADLLAEHREIVFCFVGGGAQFQTIKQACKRAACELRDQPGAPRMMCLPYQPLGELSASLSAADAHLVVMGEHLVGIVHPCKIYNILRLAKPIIYVGPNPSPASEILEAQSYEQSVSVAHGNAEGLARQICKMSRQPRAVGVRHWPVASLFSKETLLPRLVSALESWPDEA